MKKKMTINLVVRNGEKYIRHCLDALRIQSCADFEVNILDNASGDSTKSIIKEEYPEFRLVESQTNLGLGKGVEKLLEISNGEYITALCVDVILDKNFVSNAISRLDAMAHIGALQPKIYQYSVIEGNAAKTDIIDTCGFKIFRSRRLINIGHGEKDIGQYDQAGEIFSFEGAAPIFRKKALETCFVNGELYDTDFFWYGDDIDLGWRMRLFGWPSYYDPSVTAFHDRQTTKTIRRSYRNFIAIRRTLPMNKRRLDWINTRFALIKNDYVRGLDWFKMLKREMMLAAYLVFFEPAVVFGALKSIRLVPKMVAKRKLIKARTVADASDIEKWLDDDVYII